MLANDSDADLDTLTITAVTQGSNGTVAISGDGVVYTHGGSETTSDSFTYTVGDGNGGTDTANVTITVTPVNDPPLAVADTTTVAEGGPVVVGVLANDTDAEQDTLTITDLNQGLNGTAAISGDSVTYTHDGSQTTGDSFTYTISDGNGGTDTGTLTVTVTNVNDPPVAQIDAASVVEGGTVAVDVLSNDSDPDGDTLTINSVTQPSNGTTTVSGDSITYTHDGSRTTGDTFSYTIIDGKGGSDTATVTITVTAANDPPVATGDTATVSEAGSVAVNVLVDDADPDGDPLTITAVTPGANGATAISGDSVVYTHNGSETTGDSLTYTIGDGNGGNDTATVTVTITPVNDPPLASGDAATVAEGASVVVTCPPRTGPVKDS